MGTFQVLFKVQKLFIRFFQVQNHQNFKKSSFFHNFPLPFHTSSFPAPSTTAKSHQAVFMQNSHIENFESQPAYWQKRCWACRVSQSCYHNTRCISKKHTLTQLAIMRFKFNQVIQPCMHVRRLSIVWTGTI